MENPTASIYLALLQHPAISSTNFSRLLLRFGSLQGIWQQSGASLAALGFDRAQIQLLLSSNPRPKCAKKHIKSLKWAENPKNSIIAFEANEYPEQLRQIPVPPPILYSQGNQSTLKQNIIAMVGSRRCSSYGNRNAQWMAHDLALSGLVVCSGLARGIDGQSHRGALKAHGQTIAVVVTGLDQVYPIEHVNLAKEISETGLLISEFPLETPPRKENFPQRNRIISGLSLGVLVVEASIRSGSLITARLALEQNRDVFVIPGAIDNKHSEGCHWLIKQGAKLIESPEEIVEDYDFLIQKESPENSSDTKQNQTSMPNSKVSETQQQIIAAIGTDQCLLDYLLTKTGLPIGRLTHELMCLEIEGRIESKGGRYFLSH